MSCAGLRLLATANSVTSLVVFKDCKSMTFVNEEVLGGGLRSLLHEDEMRTSNACRDDWWRITMLEGLMERRLSALSMDREGRSTCMRRRFQTGTLGTCNNWVLSSGPKHSFLLSLKTRLVSSLQTLFLRPRWRLTDQIVSAGKNVGRTLF